MQGYGQHDPALYVYFINQTSKNIVGDKYKVSHCWRKNSQIRKGGSLNLTL